MSHRNPNQANIPAEFHGEPKTEVEKVKAKYDGQFRALWCVPPFSYLVGTDAEGIQLRVLAHLMRSEEYVHAIVSGKKEDETDIHNLNRKALGAGNAKIAQILKVNQREAGQAVENFMESIQGLSKLKKQRIPEIASRGWFKGLDGRKVKVPNAHKTLAGMLQNGESVPCEATVD
jgi:DNA polymerase-1